MLRVEDESWRTWFSRRASCVRELLSFYAVLPNSDLVVNVRGGAVRITEVPVGSGRLLLRLRLVVS